MRFGAHMSIVGGVSKALARGEEVGCDAVQIFLRPNLNWRLKPLEEDEVGRFEAAKRRTGIDPVVGHASYLINLAAVDEEHYRRSVEGMATELERAEKLNIRLISLHPGAHRGQGEEKGIEKIAQGLDKAFKQAAGTEAKVLLETTSGMGTALGYRFEHLAEIMSRSHFPQRLGVCVDTCHIFAAGYDMRTAEACAGTMRELSRVIGLRKVLVIHANDSRGELGGRLDRHEHIGKGRIGLEGFRPLVNDPNFEEVPVILETPKEKGRESGEKAGSLDRRNLKTLRGLRL